MIVKSKFLVLLPQLTELYPNHLMEAVMYCTSPPALTFASTGTSAITLGQIDVSVIENNGTLTPAFSLSGELSFSFDVS